MNDNKDFRNWLKEKGYNDEDVITGDQYKDLENEYRLQKNKKQKTSNITFDMLYAKSKELRMMKPVPNKKAFMGWLSANEKLKARDESEWLKLAKEFMERTDATV